MNIPDVFLGLTAGLEMSEELSSGPLYLLTLDSKKRLTEAYGVANPKDAEEGYLELEKANKDKPHIQTVLVSLHSMQALKSAYPSYYLDTRRFINVIEEICGSLKK